MFSTRNPEDLRAMLLHMAAASAGVPEGRARLAKWLRAALALVEEDEPSPPPVLATPATAKALEEIAASLTLAASHAEFLAEKAALTTKPPP